MCNVLFFHLCTIHIKLKCIKCLFPILSMYSYPANFKCDNVMNEAAGRLQSCGGHVPIGAGGFAVASVGGGGGGANHPRKN